MYVLIIWIPSAEFIAYIFCFFFIVQIRYFIVPGKLYIKFLHFPCNRDACAIFLELFQCYFLRER